MSAQETGSDIEFEFGVETSAEYEGDIDLDGDADANVGVVEAELSFGMTYQPSDTIEAELGIVLGRDLFFVDQADDEEAEWRFELDTAFVTVSDAPVDGLSLSFGRMKLRDHPRFFLFDATLDGVRATYESGRINLDASFGREMIVDRNLLDKEEDNPKVDYGAVFLDFELFKNFFVGPYIFVRDGEDDFEGKLYYFGARSSSSVGKSWRHWFELSHVRGDDGEIDVSGYAVDATLTRVFDLAFQPSLTIGYAFGSGDSGPDDTIDRAYRQTGLQKNEATFNGFQRFKYLGEVFDPDLTNLQVFTLGVGSRGQKTSLDLVFHHYRLVEPANELGDARIEGALSPNGEKELGNEIDVVFGIQDIADIPGLTADLRVGYFWAGNAFAKDNQDDAYVISFGTEIVF